ncbi:hypothetical protein [Nocardia goodfellowii]|uniref:Uncharacterized protein n=1 Tax=Nocardia goodfellowii TaxID=882446 RepID=A0ABS4QS45_9NOCA|nr:hypothetical protein [Nocardia goodfellowii]MBP2194534.1 hypothetical protein [Nocardia goodfellowii]
MTKSGNNGPKSRARARQNRDQTTYTQAARGDAPTPPAGPRITVTSLSFGPADPVPWDAPRSWRCYHCAATGTDTAGVSAGRYVLPDGVTYVRDSCPACAPEANTSVGLQAAGLQRGRALAQAVRAGELDADRADFYRCSVCGSAWRISARVALPCHPLYDSSTDLYEHPCPDCVASLPGAELGQAHQRRAQQL